MLDAGSAPVVCWSCLWITADAADASLCTESPCGHWQCVPQANIGLSRLSSGVSPIPKDGAHKIVVPQDVRVLREPRASGSELRALNSRGFRYASVAACCSCSETPTLPSSRCSSIGPVPAMQWPSPVMSAVGTCPDDRAWCVLCDRPRVAPCFPRWCARVPHAGHGVLVQLHACDIVTSTEAHLGRATPQAGGHRRSTELPIFLRGVQL